jgi:hypothetical protein
MMLDIAGGILLALFALFVLACVLTGIANALEDRPRRPVRWEPPPPPREIKPMKGRTVLLGLLLLFGLAVAMFLHDRLSLPQ